GDVVVLGVHPFGDGVDDLLADDLARLDAVPLDHLGQAAPPEHLAVGIPGLGDAVGVEDRHVARAQGDGRVDDGAADGLVDPQPDAGGLDLLAGAAVRAADDHILVRAREHQTTVGGVAHERERHVLLAAHAAPDVLEQYAVQRVPQLGGRRVRARLGGRRHHAL